MLTLRFGAELEPRERLREGGAGRGEARSPGGEGETEPTWWNEPRHAAGAAISGRKDGTGHFLGVPGAHSSPPVR